MTLANNILQFTKTFLKQIPVVPNGFKIINPFIGKQQTQIHKLTHAFYKKYYNDSNKRRIILGSSPSRCGTAITGIPFENIDRVQKETGIYIKTSPIIKSSSTFLHKVIEQYGGYKKFYNNFYMNFVCPLGIVKKNINNKEVNCNYYDNKQLQNYLYDFIINSIIHQIHFGIDTSICYCIGSDKNYKFLSKINKEYKFFDLIIPLEHPRFITQYNNEKTNIFIDKYINAFNS